MFQKFLKIFFVFLFIFIPSTCFGSQAGIVVKHSDGEIKIRCISFEEETISGWQLLQRSNLGAIEKNGFVVEIDNEKTSDYEQMQDGDGFWSFWQYSNGWKFLNAGAAWTKVRNGDIQGWELSNGKNSLPRVEFTQICPQASPELSAAIVPSVSSIPSATDASSKSDYQSEKYEADNISTQTVNIDPVQTQIKDNASNKVTSVKDNNYFEFNLKNVSILLFLFIVFTTLVILIKIVIRKHKK